MPSAADVLNAAVNAPDVEDSELEKLSLNELRALADKKQAEPVQKTDDKKVEPNEPEDDTQDDDDDEQEFTYSIDLGDGSGIQVYKGASIQEVLDKVGEAQKHATRKIREQAEQLKKYSAQAAKDAADTEYVIGQEMLTNPTSGFKKMFKETTGVDIETFKTKWGRVEALETAQRVQAIEDRKNAAASQFLAAHPEFVANDKNGPRLERAVNLLVAEANSKNQEPDFSAILEAAYTDLSESGLLELKDPNAQEPSKKETPTVSVVAHTRRASGLTSRARTVTTTRNTEPTEEELESMPLEKLKALANQRR
jgi:hypothetical protein